MVSRLRLFIAAALVMLSACGGGGSAGISGSPASPASPGNSSAAGDSASLDRSSVALAWEQGGTPAEGSVQVSTSGTAASPLYVGIGAPGGAPDPNIDHVAVDLQSASRATVRVVPKAALASGNYSGTVEIRACLDAACGKSYAGSPFKVAYSFTVTPPASAFDASPRTLVLEGEAQQPLAQLVKVSLPAGVTSYTATAVDPATKVDQVTPDGFRVTVPGRAVGGYTTTVELAAGTLKRTVTVQQTATPRRL